MRKIYIDCGWYRGKGWSLFQNTKEYSEGFEVFAFDAFTLKDQKNSHNFTYYNKAVWIFDGFLKMYSSSRRGGQTNGIYKNQHANNQENIVECIDLSKWIINNFSKDDYIVLKMDIEGAEKEVLNKMVQDGSIDLIKILYLENHAQLDNDIDFQNCIALLKKKMGDNIGYRSAIEWVFNKHKK